MRKLAQIPLVFLIGCSTAPKADAPAARPASAQAKIRAAIESNKELAKSCYERALGRNESLKGKLVLTWTIPEDRKAKDIRVVRGESTIAETRLERCLIEMVASIDFSQVGGNPVHKITAYPYIFDLEGNRATVF